MELKIQIGDQKKHYIEESCYFRFHPTELQNNNTLDISFHFVVIY
jgi:hypothetical protein